MPSAKTNSVVDLIKIGSAPAFVTNATGGLPVDLFRTSSLDHLEGEFATINEALAAAKVGNAIVVEDPALGVGQTIT
ncbi:MAG: hypothetical protein ACKVH0_12290, partial [Alphaproteobacteria bacterium]